MSLLAVSAQPRTLWRLCGAQSWDGDPPQRSARGPGEQLRFTLEPRGLTCATPSNPTSPPARWQASKHGSQHHSPQHQQTPQGEHGWQRETDRGSLPHCGSGGSDTGSDALRDPERQLEQSGQAPLEMSAAADPPSLAPSRLASLFVFSSRGRQTLTFSRGIPQLSELQSAWAHPERRGGSGCCAPLCSLLRSLLRSSRQQADRRAARLDSCAPAVHAWHGRSDPWIPLSSQDKVHPI